MVACFNKVPDIPEEEDIECGLSDVRLACETEAIRINASDCAHLLAAGGNEPAKTEFVDTGPHISERLMFISPDVQLEMRIKLSQASCQVNFL